MEPVKVQVTRKLINWAFQQSSTQCAIAQALKDASPDFIHPRVTQKTISVTDARNRVRYYFDTPEKLATWIDNFDRNPEECKPVTFTLDPEQADKIRAVQHRTPAQAIEVARKYRDRNKKTARPVVNPNPTYRELRDVKE